ncbi:hypothetical protein BC829DRAFT_91618 [Chytridium lagenaria]|nr:hypothetical protein BC829DRAFT_91618 [Chytridium lagenaria]
MDDEWHEIDPVNNLRDDDKPIYNGEMLKGLTHQSIQSILPYIILHPIPSHPIPSYQIPSNHPRVHTITKLPSPQTIPHSTATHPTPPNLPTLSSSSQRLIKSQRRNKTSPFPLPKKQNRRSSLVSSTDLQKRKRKRKCATTNNGVLLPFL